MKKEQPCSSRKEHVRLNGRSVSASQTKEKETQSSEKRGRGIVWWRKSERESRARL